MRRPKYLLSTGLMILLLTACLSACSTGSLPETETSTAASETEVKEAPMETEVACKELVAGLEARGFSVDVKDVEKDILQGQRKLLIVDGDERLSVYLYEDGAEMEKDAAFLTDDGLTYDNGSQAANIQWISDPHFFKSENMILLYVGVDQDVLHALEEILGAQFAGMKSA